MKSRSLIIIAIVIVLIVGFMGTFLFCLSNSRPDTSTIPETSNIVLTGNSTYPGFYAWQLDLEEDDKVQLNIQATSAVNLYIIPDSAHQTWANQYYQTINPGLTYPTNQAFASSGQTLSTTLSFTAPSTGKFDLVALNTSPYQTSTITVSGTINNT